MPGREPPPAIGRRASDRSRERTAHAASWASPWPGLGLQRVRGSPGPRGRGLQLPVGCWRQDLCSSGFQVTEGPKLEAATGYRIKAEKVMWPQGLHRFLRLSFLMVPPASPTPAEVLVFTDSFSKQLTPLPRGCKGHQGRALPHRILNQWEKPGNSL